MTSRTALPILRTLREQPLLSREQLQTILGSRQRTLQWQLAKLNAAQWIRVINARVSDVPQRMYVLTRAGLCRLAESDGMSLPSYAEAYGYHVARLERLILVLDRAYRVRAFLLQLKNATWDWSVVEWNVEVELEFSTARYDLRFDCHGITRLQNAQGRWITLVVECDLGKVPVPSQRTRLARLVEGIADQRFSAPEENAFPALVILAANQPRLFEYQTLLNQLEYAFYQVPHTFLTTQQWWMESGQNPTALIWKTEREGNAWVALLDDIVGGTQDPAHYLPWERLPRIRRFSERSIELQPLPPGTLLEHNRHHLAALSLTLRALDKTLLALVGDHPLLDGLLIHKLDRLYRNLIELLQFVQMLRQNNITLVSVFERFDFNSIAGEMVLSLMGGLSEVYIRNLREETMKGKHGRVLKGLWNGSFPFGYCRGKCSECNDPNGKDYCPDFGQPDKVNGKHLIVHPKDGDGMRLAFALCRTREHSTSTIAQSLNQLGYRTRTKKRFTSDAVCDLLRNPFYAGWVAYKGEQHQGLHPALVDQKTFDEVQAIISEHASAPRSARTVRFFLLTGLVRCCACGGAMAGQTNVRIAKDGSRIETRFYRDRTILDDGGICGKMISADKLETQVEAEIKRIVLPPTWKERIVALAQSSPQFNVMERKRRELRSQLSRLQGLYVNGSMTSEEFERSQKLINRRIAEIALPLSQSGNRVMRMLDDFPALWDRLTREEKKRIIRRMVQAVWVREGRLESVEFREQFQGMLVRESPAEM